MRAFYCKTRANLSKRQLEDIFGAGLELKHFIAKAHANLHEHQLEDIFASLLL